MAFSRCTLPKRNFLSPLTLVFFVSGQSEAGQEWVLNHYPRN